MASLTIRNLSEETHRALRQRASQNGRSTEAEVRSILDLTVLPADRVRLGSALFRISQRAGGIGELEPLPRNEISGEAFE